MKIKLRQKIKCAHILVLYSSFINLLCDTFTSVLSCSRIEQPQCEGNADTKIVSTAVEHLHSNKPVLTKAGVSAKNVKKT